MLSTTVPVVDGDEFLGIVGFDLLVADLEREVAPWLVTDGPAFAVVNAERRVIVANRPQVYVGDLVSPDASVLAKLEQVPWRIVDPRLSGSVSHSKKMS